MNNIIMENTTIKKKRGRKPKNKEIINENPVFDNQNTTDVIVKLNLNNEINNNIELGNDNEKYEIYSLLNLYYNKMYDTTNQVVNIAKDKIHLDVFGGNLTYEGYSKDFCKLEDANGNIHVKELINNFENVNTLHNISKLKLYRNIKNKNNISTIMNLDAYDK